MEMLTWLHLSDWHQRISKDFDRKVVSEKLMHDIKSRQDIDPRLGRVDLVVFSGDLAWSGLEEEYQKAREQLLAPALEALGLDSSRLFIVPGNHDLNRDVAYNMLPGGIATSTNKG
jgi:3',5'-cyclic AMP phosphodiesterase CpdA